MPTKQEVDFFLSQLKAKIKVFDVAFRPREKNLTDLASLDILPAKRIDFILNLTADDYYAGPKRDTHNPERPDYYEFGLDVKRNTVYIKISIGLKNKQVDCMSFHIAEFPMSFPLKTK